LLAVASWRWTDFITGDTVIPGAKVVTFTAFFDRSTAKIAVRRHLTISFVAFAASAETIIVKRGFLLVASIADVDLVKIRPAVDAERRRVVAVVTIVGIVIAVIRMTDFGWAVCGIGHVLPPIGCDPCVVGSAVLFSVISTRHKQKRVADTNHRNHSNRGGIDGRTESLKR
jgi:hypothetical protein